MATADEILIASWSPEWTEKFQGKAKVIREAMGPLALRIDHIGSTAIQGLAAKPIIDIQISVADFHPMEVLVKPMAQAGYVWRQTNPDLCKRYFREQPGSERTHVHVRKAGSWHEQWALLFRDYLRLHSEEHKPYVELKTALAQRHRFDRTAYTAGKAEHLWAIIRRADRWATDVGWLPCSSDA
jgi:GrpB-like predicted nucleotidyltransferase (UPF0157 family)